MNKWVKRGIVVAAEFVALAGAFTFGVSAQSGVNDDNHKELKQAVENQADRYYGLLQANQDLAWAVIQLDDSKAGTTVKVDGEETTLQDISDSDVKTRIKLDKAIVKGYLEER